MSETDFDIIVVGSGCAGAVAAYTAASAGKSVLVVEDTTTTGNSPLTAVAAVREAGAVVAGVATVVDRATGAKDVIEAEGVEYRSLLGLADLGLA